MNLLTRRKFINTSLQTTALIGCQSSMVWGNDDQSIFFESAYSVARRIRNREISSFDLTKMMFERIDRVNPEINAIVTLNKNEALQQAQQADQEILRGKWRGYFHGVPITIKDCFKTKGLLTTSGATELKDYIPNEDAPVVERMKEAGAVILGKTNVSEWTSDWQSYNDVFGVTNNPWDVSRTPGGSTGGGAAALAAGLTYLSVGSDMGGSIRIPSHFCGVFGHKPTLGVVPQKGHLPPPFDDMLDPPEHINVVGPLARSAVDLSHCMEILGGPVDNEAIAYEWNLPSARGRTASDYRIAYVLVSELCPVTQELKSVYQTAIDQMKSNHFHVTEGWPDGIDPKSQFDTYLQALYSYYVREKTPEQMELYKEQAAHDDDSIDTKRARAYLMSMAEFQDMKDRQKQAREDWQKVFESIDAFVLPTSFITAFPHDYERPSTERVHKTPEGDRNYRDLLFWISFATLAGLPSTVVPVGTTSSGLPVGLQIIGPYLEDATPIHIASLVDSIMGGYQRPPRYI